MLGIPVPEVRKLAGRGILPPVVKGEIELVGAVRGYIGMLREPGPRTQGEICAHLDLQRRGLRDLISAGVLPAEGDERVYRIAYIRHLRLRASGHESEDGLNIMSERAKLAREQAGSLALRNAELRGDLVRRPTLERYLVRLFSGLVQRLRGVAARAAQEAYGAKSVDECREIFERHQNAALEEVAEGTWLTRHLGAVVEGGDRGPDGDLDLGALDLPAGAAADGERLG